MDVIEHDDLDRFAEAVRPGLLRDEPGNALPLGLLGQIAAGVFDAVALAVVEADGEPVGCVIRTDGWPWNVTAFDPAEAAVVGQAVGDHLASRLAADRRLTGARPVADAAAARIADVVGGQAVVVMSLRRMACREVTWCPDPGGHAQAATPDEMPELLDWLDAFAAEATPAAPPGDRARRERMIRLRMDGDAAPLWWWIVDGEPVCLVGIGSPAGSGERVAPVYTPPELRGRGYAGALVAHVTQDAFARGCRWVGLFTDASNPISNRLYAKLGYVDIGDAVEWRVDGGAAAG